MTPENRLISQPGYIVTEDGLPKSPLVPAIVSQDTANDVTYDVTIEILPDDVILEVFSFYLDTIWIASWYTLVQVCRRWRYVAFAFSRRLNLRIVCTERTAVRKALDIWPALPIAVWGTGDPHFLTMGVDNIIAALELPDRVCEIDLRCIPSQLWEGFVGAMQGPFPALTSLHLGSTHRPESVVPDFFLGRSAPRLQTLWLDTVPLPNLPTILLSARDLVHLYLWNVPNSGYISPQTMATCLATVTRLETLHLRFRSYLFLSDQREPQVPQSQQVVLPALTSFDFRGSFEYLDVLVAGINAALLDDVTLMLFDPLRLNSSKFLQFVNQAPKLNGFDRANIVFWGHATELTLFVQAGTADRTRLTLEIPYDESEQLRSLAQVCSSPLPPLFTLERLDIFEESHSLREWQDDDMESTHWLEVIRPFITLKDLYLSRQVAPRLSLALSGERVTGVLPSLQHLFLEGKQSSGAVQDVFGQFVSARQLSDHPVVVHHWERV